MAYEKWEDVKPQEGKQELAFSLLGKVDFMLWGGARFGGKTELLTMIPLVFCNDSQFRGIYFRRESSEITQSNGLWDKMSNMYPLFGADDKVSSKAWQWPSKAKISCSHMYYESDKESHRGSGQTLIAFDEIDKFSKTQVQFLMTCLRSEADVDSFMVGTLNPDPDSWCLPLVEYYLDDTGIPDADKLGVIRHFIVKDNEFIFGESEEWFQENYKDSLWIPDGTGEMIYVRPKTFTYMFFNIFDNQLGLRANPVYLSELNNLPEHEKQTQLFGNWYARPEGASLFKRQWLQGKDRSRVRRIPDIPTNIKWYRGVDKGYTTPSEVNPYPDYTALSPRFGKDKHGNYWIVGDYLDNSVDVEQLNKVKQGSRILGRFRASAGDRDQKLIVQNHYDNTVCDTTLLITKDAGAGTSDHDYTKALFTENRVKFEVDKANHNTPNKKIVDFLPFCNACEQGLVYIVEDSFNPQTLEAWYKEHETMSDDPKKNKSTGVKKDDWIDATSSGFNAALESKRTHIVARNQQQVSTLSSDYLSKTRRG